MPAKISYSYDSKTLVWISSSVIAAIFFFLLAPTLKPFVIINAGERGVLMKFGKVQEGILDEGIHGIIPLVNRVETLSVRVQKDELKADAASKDLQYVTINVALNWRVDATKVNKVYQTIGNESQIVNLIISPAVSEVVKAATAKNNAEEIITRRRELKEEIDRDIRERLSSYGVLVDDISLVNIEFSPEFAKAIEAKQIAEQEARRALFIAKKAEQEAVADINRAKGQAEAQRLLRENLTPSILQKEAIEKWNGQFPMVMGGNGALPFINITPPVSTANP
ncbi:prohibitin family protein [Laspinema olomoucense]|uniref:prohibitin family protein n=1 Tax=Laspinema olomoucense TaxID=3231600 RepID=UPI0021BA70C7|nr:MULTISPECIES: prohibitin family protein [unclassified Laspinema]MCT7974143.1 prohibitin family protein [Laspinema sp. D3d]MCT7987453.1 prohibitin family protein [Laspinema sp. D3a]MCT7993544.1 prohibitin family protein [Laspinema sp. D3c]